MSAGIRLSNYSSLVVAGSATFSMTRHLKNSDRFQATQTHALGSGRILDVLRLELDKKRRVCVEEAETFAITRLLGRTFSPFFPFVTSDFMRYKLLVRCDSRNRSRLK